MSKPSSFTSHPFDSVLQKTEAEVVARNIMVILKRTGDEWRKLSWEEYESERMKDGNFSWKEEPYFEQVIDYCVDAEHARAFCSDWEE